MMIARVAVVVGVVNARLLRALVVPLAAMMAVSLGASLWLYLRSRQASRSAEALSVTNPFELANALKFAALFVLVLLGARAATEYLGESGTYAAGVLAGATDVDAISISVAQLAERGVSLDVAATTVFLAMASNTVVKGLIAAFTGGGAYARGVVIAYGASLAAGAAALAFARVQL
jgi:uncharacterized membrane protein (DUF4010 family)